MITSPNNYAAIDSEKDPQVSFEKTEDDRNAIPRSEVLTMNVDAPEFVGMALGAKRNILVILEQLTRLEEFDAKLPDQLEDYALAFSHAHTLHLSATKPVNELSGMLEEGRKMRERLRWDGRALAARGLIPADALANCTWQSGFINVAQDLLLAINVYLQHLDRIEGKCGIDRSELEHGRRLATRMIRQNGERDAQQCSSSETAETRARAFTLLVHCYDAICRGVTFTRWHQGDAEKFAPSLYSGRRRKSTQHAEKPAEPIAVQPVTGTTPAPTPINLNAPSPFDPAAQAPSHTTAMIPGGSPFIR